MIPVSTASTSAVSPTDWPAICLHDPTTRIRLIQRHVHAPSISGQFDHVSAWWRYTRSRDADWVLRMRCDTVVSETSTCLNFYLREVHGWTVTLYMLTWDVFLSVCLSVCQSVMLLYCDVFLIFIFHFAKILFYVILRYYMHAFCICWSFCVGLLSVWSLIFSL